MEKHLDAECEESKHAEDAVQVVEIDDEENDDNDNDNDNVNDNEHEAGKVAEDCCCICQEIVPLLQRGILETCDHRFHFNCILTWAKVTNLCPLCKQRFHCIKRVDAQGTFLNEQRVDNAKQVYRPDPQDHDIVAQLRVVNEIRCQQCGSGEHADVLLVCEERNCAVACHTFCIGLSQVPVGSWYCDQHVRTRASDFIPRRATTLSSRRRTRRLASLMTHVFQVSDQGVTAASQRATRRRQPTRGIAASYALRMSRELEEIQQRADAMFARGDHLQFVQPARASSFVLSRSTDTHATGPNDIDRAWRDFERSRQIKDGEGEEKEATGDAVAGTVVSREPIGISSRFRAQFDEIVNRMAHAVSQDNYASTVSMLIPKTSRLGVVSSMKSFFQRLTAQEKLLALQLECVKHLWMFIKPISSSSSSSSSSASVSASSQDSLSSSLPQTQVVNATLAVLEMLPIAKEHLSENRELQLFVNKVALDSGVSEMLRQVANKLREKWNRLNPLESPPSSASQGSNRVQHIHIQKTEGSVQDVSERSAARDLPTISSFTSRRNKQKQPQKRPRITLSASAPMMSAETQETSKWKNAAVEYVKAKLYPTYKSSKRFSKEHFKVIVKQVANTFLQEMQQMKSEVVVSATGQLTQLSKKRLRTLIDQHYKASFNFISAPCASYSAVPESHKKAKTSVKGSG